MAERKYRTLLTEIQKVIGKSTTTSTQLNTAGRLLLGVKFKGAWPSDAVPRLKNGDMAIANLDGSEGPGSHWVGLAKEAGKLMVYDSFGRKAHRIIPALHRRGRIILDTEQDAEQGKAQKNCGQRCLAALAVFQVFGAKGFMEL
ncbi:MAG: hypothetical protein GY938_29455 [Ketobacter sp.]|nr:hypothetical protein [Ketobacter sp.]